MSPVSAIAPAVLDASAWARDLPCLYPHGLVVAPDSRFFTLEHQRIVGDVTIGRGCSHYTLRHLRIEQGCLRIEGLNFDGLVQNVWVTHSPGHGIVVGGMQPLDNGNAMHFQNVFASFSAWWGWLVMQQTALLMATCNADQNGAGGMLFNSCRGNWLSLSLESNEGTGAYLYDCSGLMSGHLIVPVPGATPLIIQPERSVHVL